MKNPVLKGMALGALTVLGLACGSQNSVSIPYPYSDTTGCLDCISTTGLTSGTLPTFNTGDTEAVTLANSGALEEYEGGTLATPQSDAVSVNIALTPETTSYPFAGGTSQVYLGTLNIFYSDNGIVHNGSFTNGTDPNDPYTSDHTYYNNVSTQIGNNYRIFFEDPVGAIVVIINAPTGTDTTTTGTGQVWFYNFAQTGAPNPLYSNAYGTNGYLYPSASPFCWQIDLGPYNCRNFNVPPSAAYGSGDSEVPGFTLLGTIPTVNIQNALGI